MTVKTLQQSVLKALYDAYRADQSAGSPYALTGGRWYVGWARPDAERPFIVAELLDEREDSTFDAPGARVSVMLWVWADADDVQAALRVSDALRTLFSHATLPFGGGDYTQYVTIDTRVGTVSGPVRRDDLAVAGRGLTAIVQEV